MYSGVLRDCESSINDREILLYLVTIKFPMGVETHLKPMWCRMEFVEGQLYTIYEKMERDLQKRTEHWKILSIEPRRRVFAVCLRSNHSNYHFIFFEKLLIVFIKNN